MRIHSATLLGAAGLLGLAAWMGPGPAPASARQRAPGTPGWETTRLSPADFQGVHATVRPDRERWTEIPWETDLTAARGRAAREGKPLLMWIMDGHPLGCT